MLNISNFPGALRFAVPDIYKYTNSELMVNATQMKPVPVVQVGTGKCPGKAIYYWRDWLVDGITGLHPWMNPCS